MLTEVWARIVTCNTLQPQPQVHRRARRVISQPPPITPRLQENHHAAAAFRLLRNPELNFLQRMPRDKLARLRRLLIDMVLATE